MRNRAVLFLLLLPLALCSFAIAADDIKTGSSGSEDHVRDVFGFNMNIPEDMKATRVGNVITVETPENYISRKVDEQTQKIEEQNKKIAAQDQKIDELKQKCQSLLDRLDALEKKKS
jgi:F0F1-type ATP synthase alpha subunit